MANLTPEVPLSPIRIQIPGVSAIPSDEQIRQEHRRLQLIECAVSLGGKMTDEEYSSAIVRHHRVILARSGMGADGPSILRQLEQLNAQMQAMEARVNAQLQGLHDQVQGLHSRLDAVDARANTNSQ